MTYEADYRTAKRRGDVRTMRKMREGTVKVNLVGEQGELIQEEVHPSRMEEPKAPETEGT